MARNQPKAPKAKAATADLKLATNAKPAKEPKTKAPKAEAAAAPGHGHNSGGKEIPEVKKKLEEILALDHKKKLLSQESNEIRNYLKEKYSLQKGVVNHEVKMMKLEKTVRVQFESAHHDLKVMTGYQMALDLKPDTIPRSEDEYVDPNDPEAEANRLATKR